MTTVLEKWAARLFWILPLSFYFLTVCRWPGWIDAPMIAGNVHALRFDTWVNTHNFFHLVGNVWGYLFPWGELHVRLNFLCAFSAAVTVYFLFLTGLRVTKNLVASATGAVALMFGHSLWWHATILEVYTLNTALLAIFLYLIVRFEEEGRKSHLYAAAYVFGLACANHVLMGLFVFSFLSLLFVRPRARELWNAKTLALVSFFFLTGFSLYLLLFVQEFNRKMATMSVVSWKTEWLALKQIVDGSTGGHFKRMMFPDFMTARQKWNWRLNYFFLLLMNYPSVAFVAGWTGLVAFARNKAYRLSFVFFAVGLVVQAFWSINYMIWDMYAFGLPVWVLFGFAAILGFDALLRSRKAMRLATLCMLPTLLIGPVLYARIPAWAQGPGFWKNYFAFFDYVSNLWDPALYFANPNKRNYDEVQRVAQAVFRILPEGAHLYDDDGKGAYPLALYYQSVRKIRPDIRHRMVFGPQMDDRMALNAAREMAGDLERGEPVFVSSPYWPERPVLNQLYALLKGGEDEPRSGLVREAARLSVSDLEKNFPHYELKRIALLPDRPFFIYRIVPRQTVPQP